ncbi:hypothetical protein ACROYT_G019939 [Oculina patagonica]
MIVHYFILNVFLITVVTQAAVVDHEAPVFTYCPKDFVKDDLTCLEVRVTWQEPTATDNSGVAPSIISNRRSGGLFAVPSTSEVIYMATDAAGNTATCSFKITLKKKACPMYPPPKNGALACNYLGGDPTCAVMCKGAYDFDFNPPMLYYCNSGQWSFYSQPGISHSSQLPWPDCSNQVSSPSSLKSSGILYFFFNGDANDPKVQDAIKTNFISLMNSGLIPPPFCLSQPAKCNKDTAQMFAGAFIDQESPVFTYCPNDIVMDNSTTVEMRVYWQEPRVTDNSGVAPSVISNRRSEDLFAVPSTSEVIYTATDAAGNAATCSFRITLKKKACPMYPPPKNGALACNYIGGDPACAVMCNDAYDFVFNPQLLYYCSAGQWHFWSSPNLASQSQLPWPDCSDQVSPQSSLKSSGIPYIFFNGDANDPNVQDTIKTNFISLMTSQYVPPFFCLYKPAECNKDTAQVFAGAFTG